MKSTNKNKQIRATAKQAVAEVLADETNQKGKLEELVEGYQTDLADLSDAKAAVEEDNQSLAAENEALRSEKKDLEQKIIDLEKEISKLTALHAAAELAKNDLETKLHNMEQDAAMQKRIAELEEADLLESASVTDKLRTKIKKMDDEEFADYKGELVAFKVRWEKKVAQTATVPVGVAVDNGVDTDTDISDDVLDNPRTTAAELLKLKKQMASLTVIPAGGDDDLPEEMAKDYASMWDEEEKK